MRVKKRVDRLGRIPGTRAAKAITDKSINQTKQPNASKPMKLQPLNQTRRSPGFKAAAHILATTLALGAMLALTAQADMYHPPATTGGLQVQPVVNTATPTPRNTPALVARLRRC